jgi:hypothetical protein
MEPLAHLEGGNGRRHSAPFRLHSRRHECLLRASLPPLVRLRREGRWMELFQISRYSFTLIHPIQKCMAPPVYFPTSASQSLIGQASQAGPAEPAEAPPKIEDLRAEIDALGKKMEAAYKTSRAKNQKTKPPTESDLPDTVFQQVSGTRTSRRAIVSLLNPESRKPTGRQWVVEVDDQSVLDQMQVDAEHYIYLQGQLRQAEQTSSDRKRKGSPLDGKRRPAWSLRLEGSTAGAARYFQGKEYTATSLAGHRFIEEWRPSGRLETPENSSVAINFDQHKNKAEAREQLQQVMGEVLENHSSRLEEIQRLGRTAFDNFQSSCNPNRRVLARALANYVYYGVPCHLLYNASILKHKTLEGFLQSIDKKRFQSPESVAEYCQDLIDRYEAAEFTPEWLILKFKTEFHIYANAVNDFLTIESPRLDDVTLAHGVITNLPPEASISVETKKYVTAFTNGHPIFYKSIIDTTASTQTAMLDTVTQLASLDDPIETLDVNDNSDEASAHRRALLDKLDTLGADLQFKSVLHFFRCKDARGVWLHQSPTGRKILVPPYHLVIPQRVIHGKDYIVLVAELTYAAAVTL